MSTMLYRYPQDLVSATLLAREKRFLAHCRLENGQEVTAHCANPGSLKGVWDKDYPARVWLSPVCSPTAKLKWRLEVIEQDDGVKVGVHPNLANHLTNTVLDMGLVPSLAQHTSKRREVKYGKNSRIDFLLDCGGLAHYVEVKSISMSRGNRLGGSVCGEFPDAKTDRGLKHLHEMSKLVEEGNRAVMMYVVQRRDCEAVSIARDIDKAYAEALQTILSKYHGKFWIECYSCDVKNDGIHWNGGLPFLME